MLFSDKLSEKLKESPDIELKNTLHRIVRASERMQTLINDLLKLSRHAHHPDDYKLTDLNQVVAEVLGELDGEIQKKGAVINYRNLPSIWGVPGQVYQLFQNLIANSLKFCKTNTIPVISIESETLKGKQLPGTQSKLYENTFYRIHIRDNGIGFDPKYAEEIFVVFKRLHSYHEFEGTGIGLSICKKIVEKHKGMITAESTPQNGATFIITLPEKDLMAT